MGRFSCVASNGRAEWVKLVQDTFVPQAFNALSVYNRNPDISSVIQFYERSTCLHGKYSIWLETLGTTQQNI